MRLKQIIPLLLYLLVNSLFVLKYSSRLNLSNEFIITLLYNTAVALFILLFLKTDIRKCYYKYIFLSASVLFFAFTVYLNIAVDGKTLNVDRWSAMEAGIRALLNGEYPYSALDHMGGRTSNLPTLLFIGIPFFYMGDTGYLQSFTFLIFCIVIWICFRDYKTRLYGLLLLILSPSYLWEIYVKSDLISNFIIVLFFLIIIQKRVEENKKFSAVATAFGSIALILTRLTAIIPVSLLLFKQFLTLTLKEKAIFIITGLLTSLAFIWICFRDAGDIEIIMRNNPFELQNRYLPVLLSVVIVLFSVLYSFRVNDSSSLMKASAFFLLLPVFISFIMDVKGNGIYVSIFNSSFDISYFNIAMPFLLMVIMFDYCELLPSFNKQSAGTGV